MDGMVNVYNRDGLIRTKEIWKEGKFQRLHSFENAPCISGVFINAGQRYELPYELPKDTEELYNAPDVDSQQDIQSEQDKKTFINKKREREVGDGDLEIDNNSSQSSLKDPNKHDKKKGTFMNKKREREVGDGDLEIDNNSSQSSLKDPNKHDKKKGF